MRDGGTRTQGTALLLVGNELLSGRVKDENLPFLATELWQLGVPLRRVEVCRDDVDDIAECVARLAARHDWLFTTGGVGPTHDDVTIEGVARAFGTEVVSDPTLERLLREHFGERIEPAHLRMALVPRGAMIEDAGSLHWPTVRMQNVIVLPGVPGIMRRKFERLRERFRRAPLHRLALAFVTDEAALAPRLSETAERFPGVEIGSYPEPERVLITFESADAGLVRAAWDHLDGSTRDVPRG